MHNAKFHTSESLNEQNEQSYRKRLSLTPASHKSEGLRLEEDLVLYIPTTKCLNEKHIRLQHNPLLNICKIAHIYQLMKERFPAEWFPINITVIFFLGGIRVMPTDWAIAINPTKKNSGVSYKTMNRL